MKPFTGIAVALLSMVALMHVIRLFTRFEIVMQGHVVPIWASVPGALIFGGVAFMVTRESRR